MDWDLKRYRKWARNSFMPAVNKAAEQGDISAHARNKLLSGVSKYLTPKQRETFTTIKPQKKVTAPPSKQRKRKRGREKQFSEVQQKVIKKEVRASSQKAVAEKYNVSQGTISRIVRGVY